MLIALDPAQNPPALPIHAREAGVLEQDIACIAGIEHERALPCEAGTPLAVVLASEHAAFERMHFLDARYRMEGQQLDHHVARIVAHVLARRITRSTCSAG